MYLRFGNLTVRQFAERVNATFIGPEVEWLEAYRTDDANFTDPTKFHIFDDPAVVIVVGADALAAIRPVFEAANTRRVFTEPVTFYPASTNHAEEVGGE